MHLVCVITSIGLRKETKFYLEEPIMLLECLMLPLASLNRSPSTMLLLRLSNGSIRREVSLPLEAGTRLSRCHSDSFSSCATSSSIFFPFLVLGPPLVNAGGKYHVTRTLLHDGCPISAHGSWHGRTPYSNI